jgi:hypothetical protein
MKKVKLLSSEYSAYRDDILKIFIEKILKKPSIILDPMAGTAPLIPFIELNGHVAYFNDILPLHFFINKAKTYQVFQDYQTHGYDWYNQKLLDCMAPLEGKAFCISDKWINEGVMHGLIQAWHATERYDEDSATLLKALILLCVRPFSSITPSGNPTWVKRGGVSSSKDLEVIIRESVTKFDGYYHYHYASSRLKRRGKCIFTNQNATELDLPQKVDFILTSPPYCNRIDPLVLYGPEIYFLSVLGYNITEKNMISIPKVRGYNRLTLDLEYLITNSESACRLLTHIQNSDEKDDPNYYLKYYTRYFALLYQVIDQVLNNLSPTGKMYIVTQDNMHRGQLIEIDKILRELLRAKGWSSKLIHKWPQHHMGLRNVSRQYAFVKPKHWEKLVVIHR